MLLFFQVKNETSTFQGSGTPRDTVARSMDSTCMVRVSARARKKETIKK